MRVLAMYRRVSPKTAILSVGTFVLFATLSGCSALNFNTKSQFIVEAGKDVNISSNAWTWEEGFHYKTEGKDSVTIKLDNSESVYLIRAEKPGYYPVVLPVFRDYTNPWKLVDLLMTIGGTATAAAGFSQDIRPGLAGTGLFTGLLNAIGFFTNPKKVFAKKYQIDKIRALPFAHSDEPPVRIEGFHMHIPEGGHTWQYFQNIDKFSENRVEFVSASDEAVDIAYSNLDEDFTEKLIEQGYHAENKDGMFQEDESILISGQLTQVNENRVQNIVSYQLFTEWWVHNAYGMKTDTIHIENNSNWGLYNFSNPGFDRGLISEALTESMFHALEHPALRESMNKLESLEERWKSNWTPITLKTAHKPAGKISSALPSVVTIDALDGHGSGCILSSDGYIITNYHVISDPLLDYTVYFDNGSSLPATVVRFHPIYDLALLHVDTTGLHPFHVSLDEAIDVGEETFAMGTPYDIDLGASVTKGIISGKRKDGERTLIQTDVSISPGNSGGALVHPNGTLIGIVNEKVLGMGVEGIGFAIPAHLIQEALMVRLQPEER
jgi:hypothetical protein